MLLRTREHSFHTSCTYKVSKKKPGQHSDDIDEVIRQIILGGKHLTKIKTGQKISSDHLSRLVTLKGLLSNQFKLDLQKLLEIFKEK